MPKGILNLKHIKLPTAWDAAELQRLTLREGVSYADIIQDIDDALSIALEDAMSGWLSTLIYLTSEVALEYGSGVSNQWEDHTERSQPDSRHGDKSGHMLPIKTKDWKLGWTADALEEIRQIDIDEAVGSMADGLVDIWEQGALQRAFKLEEESGRAYGLGATGVSVPFCDGGNGSVPYVPKPNPTRASSPFMATHNHFLRLDGINQANFEEAMSHVWEHGADAPFDLLISEADVAAWQNTSNVTGFKEKADALIQYGVDTDLAQVSEGYIGAVVSKRYGSARVRPLGRIPTGYWAIYKSYGQNDPRNPIYARYDAMMGYGAKLVVAQMGLYPLQGAIGQMKIGFGVGRRRDAMVLVKNDTSGTYTTPTIS